VVLRQAGALPQQDAIAAKRILAAASPDTVVHNPFTNHSVSPYWTSPPIETAILLISVGHGIAGSEHVGLCKCQSAATIPPEIVT
jgi:hypothetical protein